jgi:sterol desaturase/sphingolipid hydroxylase (fatty acid hydroxylase superfamily)
MSWINTFLNIGLSLLFLSVLFIPMEKVFPAKKGQKIFRKGWCLDFTYFLGQYLVWGAVVLFFLNFLNGWINQIIPESFRVSVANQNWWLQCFEMIVLSDFLIYWAHRLQHKVDFLWRFHKVHHTAEKMDWLAAHREHPLDSIYTVGLINLPAIVMGFSLESIAGLIAFRGVWAIYIHSNVRFSIGGFKKIIGSPELHHWHHDLERNAGNYANISPLMDVIFGTYKCPDFEPEKFGVKEQFPKNYLAQMIYPMLPNFILNRLKKNQIK